MHELSSGVREKLARAHMHRLDFEKQLERFIRSRAYQAIRHDDLSSGRRVWRFDVGERPPAVEWGGIIGDCLFDFRSALDHLAYDLAVAYTGHLSEKVERTSAFPIFVDRAPSARELDDKIGAIHPDARRLIEEMQPHDHPERVVLGLLERLHNFDKHRTLHLVAAISTGVTHRGEQPPFDSLDFRPLEHGDEIASGPVPDDPSYDQGLSIVFGVAFAQDGPGRGYEVAMVLDWIGQHIEQSVIPPLLPFL